MQKVFVMDAENKPLLPCHPARARKLLDSGKAELIQVLPFSIRLKRKVDNPAGSFKAGIDDGARHVGVAILNDKTNEVVFKGQIDLRQDVKLLMEKRSRYRRVRRYRKTRHRKPRFDNRTGSKLAPSLRCRKDSTLRFIADMQKRLNIISVTIEEVSFNHAKNHYGKHFSQVEVGKLYLRERLAGLGLEVETTRGWITKQYRATMGLSKKHSNDAIAIVACGEEVKVSSKEWLIKPRRSKEWEKNPTKKCSEKEGFRHYDIVKASHRSKGEVMGSIRSLKEKAITIRTTFSDNFAVSYRKTKLLQRPRGLIFTHC
ncbi:MAG: RRXRR domain-containing protein [Blastocatellia bacterium]|nr:RRXRR domain-containing protein [Blastocatellia bacterium]